MKRRGVSDLWLERLRFDWLERPIERRAARLLGLALVIGLPALVGLAVGLGLGRTPGNVALLVGGPMFAVAVLTRGYRVEPSEALRWSWRRAVKKLPANLLIGLGVGLVAGLVGDFVMNLRICLFGGAVLAVVAAIEPGQRETRVRPNEGIRRSLWYATLLPACVMPPTIMMVTLTLLPPEGEMSADLIRTGYPKLAFALYAGTFESLVLFMLYGGVAVLFHLAVRGCLAIRTPLSFSLVPFLDDCVRRGLLRRVGGGYMFLHRTLLDHFADRWANEGGGGRER